MRTYVCAGCSCRVAAAGNSVTAVAAADVDLKDNTQTRRQLRQLQNYQRQLRGSYNCLNKANGPTMGPTWDRSDTAQWNSIPFVAAVAASVLDAVADSVFSLADLANPILRYEQGTLY